MEVEVEVVAKWKRSAGAPAPAPASALAARLPGLAMPDTRDRAREMQEELTAAGGERERGGAGTASVSGRSHRDDGRDGGGNGGSRRSRSRSRSPPPRLPPRLRLRRWAPPSSGGSTAGACPG